MKTLHPLLKYFLDKISEIENIILYFYSPYAVPNWAFGIIKATIGHNEAYNKESDIPKIRTGINEFIYVNISNTWDKIAIKIDNITHSKLYPVQSTIFPNIGEVTTVEKKNKLILFLF